MDKEQVIQLIDQNYNRAEAIIDEKIEIWKEHVLFSGLWWFGVVLSILPWVLWFAIRRKQSTDRLLYVAFIVTTISLSLDVLGDQWGFWHYRFNVIPILPTYLPWDITLMPVAVIGLLQYKPAIHPIWKALLFALGTAYIAEPFIHWIGIYTTPNWRYSYSVPIQFGIYMLAHYVSRRNRFEPLQGGTDKGIDPEQDDPGAS